MASVFDRITPEGKKFYKEIDELKKLAARVGYQHGDASEEDGADIADVAMWNELGTVHAPARPFLRQSVDNNESRISSMCRTKLKGIANGTETAQSVYQALGVMQKGLIQQEILSGDFVPNAPATIAKKGSDRPLIDSGRMRQSVNFVIEPKGS